jgi:hypothetical protein
MYGAGRMQVGCTWSILEYMTGTHRYYSSSLLLYNEIETLILRPSPLPLGRSEDTGQLHASGIKHAWEKPKT